MASLPEGGLAAGPSGELESAALLSAPSLPPVPSLDALASPRLLPGDSLDLTGAAPALAAAAIVEQQQQPQLSQPGEGEDVGVGPLLRSRPPSVSCLIPLGDVAPAAAAAAAAAEAEAAAAVAAAGAPATAGLGAEPSDEGEDAGPASPRLLRPAAAGSDEEDEQGGSSCGLDSPARRADQAEVDAGYESSDDMDFMNMRHCINCTGELWGSVCRACGYMDGHEASIFDPVVTSPPRALHLRAEGSTVIAFDDRMLLHDENLLPLHPERADRLRAVMARLNAAQLTGRCRRLPSREATPQEVERCHIPDLMNAINVLSERSRLQQNETIHWPTGDTYVNQHTALCARLSAGACVDVAVAVARGEAASGVAIVRPPGHHAESNTAMGFCFFNNAGIAARAAQAAGARRVVIVDWDVHHGNGTQHMFEDDPSVMYMSLHRYDGGQFYPGTGSVTEVGHDGAEGTTVNVPWPCGGMRNGDYMAAFQHVILPIAQEFAPDLMIISAGFDAAEGDPIGGCCLTPEVYAHMTAMLQNVAPTVLLLEGGYNLLSVARSTEACVRVLLGERPPPLPAHQGATEAGMSAVALAMRVQARYWRSMRGLLQRLLPLVAHGAGSAAAPATAAAAAAGLASPLYGEEEEEEALAEEEGEEGDQYEDTDTPHLPYGRGASGQFAADGSGWESDADPHSGASLGADSQEQGAVQPRHPRPHPRPLGCGGAGGEEGQHQQQLEPSDTDMDSEAEEEGAGDEAHSEGEDDEGGLASAGGSGPLLQHANSGQLLGQLSPPFQPCAAQSGDATPSLAPSPATTVGSAGWGAGGGGLAAAQQEEEGQGGEDGAATVRRWQRLALKVVSTKRPAQKTARLSPQLLREALSGHDQAPDAPAADDSPAPAGP